MTEEANRLEPCDVCGELHCVASHDFFERSRAASLRAAPSPTNPVDAVGAEAVETGWLIEEKGGGFIHWIALGKGRWPRTSRSSHPYRSDRYVSPLEFVKDANAALRFARKEDAEAFMTMFEVFLLNPVVTEHVWHNEAALRAQPVEHDGLAGGAETLDDETLCKRLREGVRRLYHEPGQGAIFDVVTANQAMRKAAERLATLSRQPVEAEGWRALLQPFASRLDVLEDTCRRLDCGVPSQTNVLVADLRRARAFLSTTAQAGTSAGPHPSHKLRSSDASTFDVICENCRNTDHVPGGWGKLVEPCPAQAASEDAVQAGEGA